MRKGANIIMGNVNDNANIEKEEVNTVTEGTTSSNDSQASDEGLQKETVATGEKSTEEESTKNPPASDAETNANNGENATPKQTKEENSFFKHMRIKAEKEAETKFKEQLDGFKSRLKKVLPDGYEDVDEFLATLTDEEVSDLEDELDNDIFEDVEDDENDDSEPEDEPEDEEIDAKPSKKKVPLISEEELDELIAKRLENNPKLKKIFEEEERKKQEEESSKKDKYIVDSFAEVKSKFADIKSAEDVPLEVWEMWQLGNTGRTLLSCMKEYRYDNDIEKAKNKGAAVAKGQANSVAHTGVVNGGSNGGTVQMQSDVEVPPETQAMLKKAGIPKEKWVAYYQKYHR
jgi:hypothetical protein